MKNKFIRYVCWVLTLAVMVFIFYSSSETAEESNATSMGFSAVVVEAVYPDFDALPENEKIQILENIQLYIRKLAHFSVYAALGACSFSALCTYGLKRYITAIYAFLICAAYAASDEIHQLFVMGRSGEFADVCLDSFGAACGIAITALAIFLYESFKRRRKNEQKQRAIKR